MSTIILLALLFCLPVGSTVAAVKKSKPAVPIKEMVASTSPEDLPATAWVGRQFILLDMPPQYRAFGYELYLSGKLGSQTGPVDTVLTLKNRRIRYDMFHGRTITATSAVKSDSGEFLVTFSLDSAAILFYARTRSQAVKGIAPKDDLDRARARWTGKTVYSRRGFISMADSTAAVITTCQVAIQTPLPVTGVRPGVSPLPTQFIWVMVRTPQGHNGFIPTHLTWTNVMTRSRKECRPWQDDLLETDPRTLYRWDEATWNAVNVHTVFAQMSRDQVVLSWGYPFTRDSADVGAVRCERWIYQSQYVYFKDDIVLSVENR